MIVGWIGEDLRCLIIRFVLGIFDEEGRFDNDNDDDVEFKLVFVDEVFSFSIEVVWW